VGGKRVERRSTAFGPSHARRVLRLAGRHRDAVVHAGHSRCERGEIGTNGASPETVTRDTLGLVDTRGARGEIETSARGTPAFRDRR
jgi:hypothetical protein